MKLAINTNKCQVNIPHRQTVAHLSLQETPSNQKSGYNQGRPTSLFICITPSVPNSGTPYHVFIMGTMIKSVHHPKYQALLEYLKTARLERGLTVRDFALLIDDPFQFVSKVESGQRRLTVHEFVQYCEALDLNPMDGIKLLSDK